jgi:hypothetical protein
VRKDTNQRKTEENLDIMKAVLFFHLFLFLLALPLLAANGDRVFPPDLPIRSTLTDVGIPADQVDYVLSRIGVRDPQLVKDVVTWLSDKKLKLSKKKRVQIILNHPPILSYSPAKNLTPKLEWLESHGVRTAKLGNIVFKCPKFFSYSISEKMDPAVEELSKYGVKNVAKLLEDIPAIMGASIQVNLRPTLEILTKRFVLTPTEIEEQPLCLGADVKRLEPLMDWMDKYGVNFSGFSPGERVKIIRNSQKELIEGNLFSLDASLQGQGEEIDVRIRDTLSHLAKSKLLFLLLKKGPGGPFSTRSRMKCLKALGAMDGTQRPEETKTTPD